MSLQRAQVNCRRCYALVRIIGDAKEIAITPVGVYQDDQVYAARNEAMKALDEHIRDCILDTAIRNTAQNDSGVRIALPALDACVKCDYSAPGISLIINKMLSEEEKK